MLGANLSVEALRSAVQLACQPQNAGRIVAGRKQVLDLPRDWVVGNFVQVAAEALDLSDNWEYRRLLELAELLDAALVKQLILVGLQSEDPELREAAEDYRVRLASTL